MHLETSLRCCNAACLRLAIAITVIAKAVWVAVAEGAMRAQKVLPFAFPGALGRGTIMESIGTPCTRASFNPISM